MMATMFTVRGANMWANYTIGNYEAEDEAGAIDKARRDKGHDSLVGLLLRTAPLRAAASPEETTDAR